RLAGLVLGSRESLALEDPAGLEEVVHALIRERVDRDPQREAVLERAERGIVACCVRRGEREMKRRPPCLLAAPKPTVVEDAEERVEDRRAGVEDLVEEGDLRLGKPAFRHRLEAALAQSLEVDRPEDLGRLRESG